MAAQAEARLLQNTNLLLRSVGLHDGHVSTLDELQQSASSMFVAVFESVFGIKLRGVCRRPQEAEDYVSNAELVLDGLRRMLPDKVQIPAEITGQALFHGELPAIAFMTALFSELNRVLPQRNIKGKPRRAPNQQRRQNKNVKRSKSRRRRRRTNRGIRSTRGGSLRIISARKAKLTGDHGPQGNVWSSPWLPDRTSELHESNFGAENGELPAGAIASVALPGDAQHVRPARSGEGLGPDGRPGTAIGGARSHEERERISSLQAPNPFRQSRELLLNSTRKLRHNNSAQENAKPSFRIRAEKDHTANDIWDVASKISSLDTHVSTCSARPPPPARTTNAQPDRPEAPLNVHAGKINALMASYRRRQAVRAQRELERAKLAQAHALRLSAAQWRAEEQKYAARSKLRARAAKHSRKVDAIRTKRFLEEIQCQQVSFMLDRENKRDVMTNALFKAVAAQQRMMSINQMRAAKADALEVQSVYQRKQQALNHSIQIQKQLMREAITKQLADQAVETAAHQEELRRSAREATQQQKLLLQQTKETMKQANEQWLTKNVDVYDLHSVLPSDPTAVLESILPHADKSEFARALAVAGGNQNSLSLKPSHHTVHTSAADSRRKAWGAVNIRGATMRNSASGGGGGSMQLRASSAFGSPPPVPRKFGGPGLYDETRKHMRRTTNRCKSSRRRYVSK